eukprot:1154630-Pelagomonas_calceolata.AAC.1
MATFCLGQRGSSHGDNPRAIRADVIESLGMQQYGGTCMQADAVFEVIKKQKKRKGMVVVQFCGTCGHLCNSGAMQAAMQALQSATQPTQPS